MNILSQICFTAISAVVIFSYSDAATNAQRSRSTVVTDKEWSKVSDSQIARLLFPKERVHFGPFTEPIPTLDSIVYDGIYVSELRRVIENFDHDTESEMAVQVVYSTGLCTQCVNNVLVAVLDRQRGQINIAWRSEEGGAFDNEGNASISTSKLVTQSKYAELTVVFSRYPIGGDDQRMTIIRWDGKVFKPIWTHNLKAHNSGARGSIPERYIAQVRFLDDDKAAKRIRVSSLYTTWPNREENRTQYTISEEFVWNEKKQGYFAITRSEEKYHNHETCYFREEYGRTMPPHCYKLESHPTNKGLVALQENRFQDAVAEYTELMRIDPKAVEAYRMRGYAYRRLGHHQLAIFDLNKAIELSPSVADNYYERAGIYKEMGRHDEAIADYTQAARLRSDDPWIYITRGGVYHEKGMYQEAISDYTQALGMKAASLWAQYARGLSYLELGQYDQAIADFTPLTIDPNANADVRYQRGLAYLGKGDFDRAILDFDHAIRVDPNKSEAYFYKADAFERSGRSEDARQAFRAFIESIPATVRPLALQARKRLSELER